ncbi:MAG: hypothetical protein HZB09_01655 [Candidatus Yonathbacteria bacterium]|nr:hypothetical protein [Candidatus Yonathbacteria bacterium]
MVIDTSIFSSLSVMASTWAMVWLDVLMIIYTLWVFSLIKPKDTKIMNILGFTMITWLILLYLGLSTRSIFPADISGIAFLGVIFLFVGIIGIALFFFRPIRSFLLELDQRQLLLLQGIRVFFGATFLMQASLGILPTGFGIVDGYTHIGAGFFGLIAAFSLAQGVNGTRRAWFANIFGLADILVVASSLALVLLKDIGPYHSMMYAVFFPAPLWLWLHIISIWKLVGNSKVVRTF